MKKVCHRCGKLEEFARNTTHSSGLQSACKKCRKITSRAYYQENRNAQVGRVAATRRKRASQLLEYLSTKKCQDCIESDPIVLEFDHVRGVKRTEISVMVLNGFSWESILLEISKCEIRCANCHRRKTMKERKQFRWRKTMLPELGR